MDGWIAMKFKINIYLDHHHNQNLYKAWSHDTACKLVLNIVHTPSEDSCLCLEEKWFL